MNSAKYTLRIIRYARTRNATLPPATPPLYKLRGWYVSDILFIVGSILFILILEKCNFNILSMCKWWRTGKGEGGLYQIYWYTKNIQYSNLFSCHIDKKLQHIYADVIVYIYIIYTIYTTHIYVLLMYIVYIVAQSVYVFYIHTYI